MKTLKVNSLVKLNNLFGTEMENLVDQTVVNLEREHDAMEENDWHSFLCFLIAELTIAIRVSHDPLN